MGRLTRRRRIVHYSSDTGPRGREETIAAEEPLEIRLGGRVFSITMRTPGNDFDLVAGFLVSEGVIGGPDELSSMRFCAGEDEDGRQTFNVVEAGLGEGAIIPDPSLDRHVFTSSSCGICGTASIDAVAKTSRFIVEPDSGRIGVGTLLGLSTTLRSSQELFGKTGGVHAAGLFDTDGNLLCLREDVGRHNAVDKVVGWALREGRLPLRDTVLQVSGRASFELVQKAYLAGIPVLCAVSAPSSLAVELAERAGLTVAAFARGSSVNLYTHPDRIDTDDSVDQQAPAHPAVAAPNNRK
ncbi:formate dehydrogenase accessory sulfurtransferase FdhD [Arthrobacter rhombi]|uniref:Sulfur carrier protein FdhD n=1 Tax=Arthrobacter rhombi TaxID=71253 RepID=A0A1R4FIG6_9MICC|nr:formate dehydrogenase accessory sulfurtransferase FdhD [Arthrobacter rhombi]SJM55688.1 Formate dehydrogenase chain D [Arthrobacter rhombi]